LWDTLIAEILFWDRIIQCDQRTCSGTCNNANGLKELKTKIINGKATTINRNRCKPSKEDTKGEKDDVKRKKTSPTHKSSN
jgi:hypothetical protein